MTVGGPRGDSLSTNPDLDAHRALRNVDVAVVMHDRDGVIIDCNDAAAILLGLARDEVLGRSLRDATWHAIGPDGEALDAARHPQAGELVAGRASGPFEMGVRRPSGELRWLRVTGGPVPGSEGLTVTTFTDITDERSLARAHAICLDCHDVLIRSRSIAELLDETCRVLASNEDHVLVWIGVAHDDIDQSVEVVVAHGAADYLYDGIVTWSDRDERGRGPVGVALREGRAALVADVAADAAFGPWHRRAERFGISSVVAVPFRMGGHNAALIVYARQPAAFNDRSLPVLARFGRDLEYGIENLTRVEMMRASLESTVLTIANLNEIRDSYTSGHQRRVARLAEKLGQMLDLDEPAVTAMRLGALVHDVGKIAVPAEILSKPSVLHPVELSLVQRHAEVGQQLLEAGSLPAPFPQIAGQHHERLDGSGYPKGLTGDGISIEARIVAVADVVEAITHHRPYRPALGQATAIDVIEHGAGTLFEPEVVRACTVALEHGFSLDTPQALR